MEVMIVATEVSPSLGDHEGHIRFFAFIRGFAHVGGGRQGELAESERKDAALRFLKAAVEIEERSGDLYLIL